jgi:hypothetical protein
MAPAGRRDSFEPGRDIDSIAHEVAVAFLDDVAKVNADAVFDAPFGRDARRCGR